MLIVASIVVTVALRDDIVECRQAIGLRSEWTSSRGSSPPPGGETGVLPVSAIVHGKVKPGKKQSTQQSCIWEKIAYTLLSDSQLLHPLWEEQLAAVATLARLVTTTTLETINLVNCMVKDSGIPSQISEHSMLRSGLRDSPQSMKDSVENREPINWRVYKTFEVPKQGRPSKVTISITSGHEGDVNLNNNMLPICRPLSWRRKNVLPVSTHVQQFFS